MISASHETTMNISNETAVIQHDTPTLIPPESAIQNVDAAFIHILKKFSTVKTPFCVVDVACLHHSTSKNDHPTVQLSANYRQCTA